MRDLVSVILAAGKGKRMKSNLTKLVHELFGKPLVGYVADLCVASGIKRNIVIVGCDAQKVKEALGDKFEYVLQREQLGTAHALMQARDVLRDYVGDLLVIAGDSPFFTKEIIQKLTSKHQDSSAAATLVTAVFEETPPYGRIVRDEEGRVIKIVEERDATPEEKAIKEVNTSLYCFKAEIVLPLLSEIDNNNVQGEYYLTDIVSILVKHGFFVETVRANDPRITIGINNRVDLAEALKILKKQTLESVMLSGVTVIDPATTFIDSTVEIGMDTIIYPFSILERNTKIGKNCIVGPQVRITNSIVADNCRVEFSVVEDSEIETNGKVGPFAHICGDNKR